MKFRRLAKMFSLASWEKQLRARVDRVRAGRLRPKVEARYAQMARLDRDVAGRWVITDGMWDNPNHFMRVRLFLEALAEDGDFRLLAILRKHGDRTRTTLEALGFQQFVYIEEDAQDSEAFVTTARALLAKVRSHRDLLNLDLPQGLPAYTFYDTVLKITRHPQPPLNSPVWEQVLAETLRNLAIYDRLLSNIPVAHIVLSHPWKSEFACLVWCSISRGIPAYHLTAYCEGIRIRRFCRPEDYQTPVEYLSVADYQAMPTSSREALHAYGAKYMQARVSGTSTDINARYAFRPELRCDSAPTARAALGGQVGRPLVVIYSHVWYDFPHTFGMKNFTDFLDWMQFTLEVICEVREVDWVLKPHPTEQWYGGFALKNLLGALPPHIRLAPDSTDSLTTMLAADAIVTVHGTVALEATAYGLPVICADRSYYSDWGFVQLAQSREDYARLLRTVAALPRPDERQRYNAVACIAMALAPTPAVTGVLELRCDSSGARLYEDILMRLDGHDVSWEKERQCISAWLRGRAPSYSVDLKMRHFSEIRHDN